MRDPERIKEVLAEVERVWNTVPDMRFGQLVVNILQPKGIASGQIIFNLEDDVTLERFKKGLSYIEE